MEVMGLHNPLLLRPGSGGDLVAGSGEGFATFLSGLAFCGSGGTQASLFYSGLSGASAEVVKLLAGNPSAKGLPHNTEPAMVGVQDTIGDVFGLSMEQLAHACGVTRKTLYNWRAGVVPRQDHAARVFTIYRAALNWQRAGYPEPAQLLYAPILGERSLFDLLTAERIEPEAIDLAGGRLALRRLESEVHTLEAPFG